MKLPNLSHKHNLRWLCRQRLKAATLARGPEYSQGFVQRGGSVDYMTEKGGPWWEDGLDPSRLVVGPAPFFAPLCHPRLCCNKDPDLQGYRGMPMTPGGTRKRLIKTWFRLSVLKLYKSAIGKGVGGTPNPDNIDLRFSEGETYKYDSSRNSPSPLYI